jgi:type 1 glutamine amidotransferase
MIMPAPAEQVAAVLQRATERGQGLVILHHALLAYPDWPFWTGLVGIKDRAFGYHHGQKIRVKVPEARHPVTASMQSWNMTDETYTMQEPDLAPASDILLTLDHEKSMNAIAWTRTIGSSRVFCYQGGHDAQTWTHESFRKVLLRGTLWCARRI